MARPGKKGPEPATPKKVTKSPQQLLAEKVRYHKDLDSRWAILQEARVEYFRGKDFSVLVENHPDLALLVMSKEEVEALTGPNAALDKILAEALLRSGLIVRCDRVVKIVRPGKKKLSKWPARLEVHRTQAFTTEEGFYSWTFERQSPLWQTVLTILFPIFTVGCCLFPVFPHWAKLTVLYFLLSLIAAIFLLLTVRLFVFTAIWVATGKRVWFFPRILEEEGTLAELFRFWPDKDEEPPAKLTTRAAVAITLGFVFWLMVQYAPDENTRASYRKRVTNIIDEFASWKPQMIAGNTTSVPSNATTVPNATDSSNNTSNTDASEPLTTSTSSEKVSLDSHKDSGDDGGSVVPPTTMDDFDPPESSKDSADKEHSELLPEDKVESTTEVKTEL